MWPYNFAVIGRGQKYHWQSVPDHGMLLIHLLVCMEDAEFTSIINESGCLKRSAYWYLLTSRYTEDNSITIDYEEKPGDSLGFSCFSWCRFIACAVLSKVYDELGNVDFWRNFIRSQLSFISKNIYLPDSDKAPIKASVIPLTLHSWIHALEWNTVLLNDTLDNIEL